MAKTVENCERRVSATTPVTNAWINRRDNPISMLKFLFKNQKSVYIISSLVLGLAQRTRLVTSASDLQVACRPF
jgi:hypothetical protein